MRFHNLCDYCGGYDVVEGIDTGQTEIQNRVGISLNVNEPSGDITRNVCLRCWIRVFDTVLGEPKTGGTR